MTKVLKLALLGPLQIAINDLPLTGLDSGKAQALLCYLAMNGRPHSRQALAGLLWGDLPESDARRNLRGVIMKLRQVVEPWLLITHQTVALNREADYWLDTEVFRAATADTAEATKLRQAPALYRDDFLADFHIRQAPDFETWLHQQRAEWREYAIRAFDTLTTWYRAQNDYANGLEIARRLLALDHLREASHRHLMHLFAGQGNRAAALAQFERCRAQLAAELGVEVAAETAELYEQIRTGHLGRGAGEQRSRGAIPSPTSPITPSPPRPQVAHPFTPSPPPFIAGPPITHPARFFGREREIKRLFNLLRQRPLQNAAVIGPRRSGKTSLLHYLKNIATASSSQCRPDQRTDWLPQPAQYRWIFVDFQDPRLGDRETLLRYLLEHMALPLPKSCDLDHFLDIVSDGLQTPTVVLFDEIGVAIERYPVLNDAFWESLRSLATNQVEGNLGFVLTSPEPPDSLARYGGFGSPFFNIFGYTTTLGPLTETSARALIASSPIPFPEADIDWILEESGRWPMLLQIMCRERLLALEEGETDAAWQEESRRQIAPFKRMKAEG